jgi:hypothetical protein
MEVAVERVIVEGSYNAPQNSVGVMSATLGKAFVKALGLADRSEKEEVRNLAGHREVIEIDRRRHLRHALSACGLNLP